MDNNLIKYIRAKRPIIWCNTNDYKEIDDLLKESIKNIENKEIYEFRALGAVDFFTKEISEEGRNLYQFIDSIFADGFDTNVFLLIKNTKSQLENPEVIAYLAKIAELRYNNSNFNFTILVVGKSIDIPKELEEFVSILEIENMNQEEIEKYILEFGNKNSIKVTKEDIGELAISLKGLTKLEIDHILNMMIENKNTISISDRNIIIKEKGQIIKKSAILELIDFKEKITDIGGLEGLKEWLESKAKVFRKLDEAITYGVDVPKGVLLVGMPGCGKSLAAKASARLFNAPLLRMDIGRLLGKYVGESEHNMRIALKTAESISPCILWIDEIEKAFSGIDQSGGASDITKRLFGQFLTWLQEKENTVFVVATANDISSFPPEFLRKGRFDEVFFVDFPNEEERERIFEIHLEKRGKNIKDIDIKKLAKATEGYCGADIEEIVKLAIERAFINEIKEIDTEDLLNSIREIDSLTVILKEKINMLKKGFNKFRIKSASEKLPIRVKEGKKIKTSKVTPINKDMVFVQGGEYEPSFFYEERKVNDLEVCKYQTTQEMWEEIMKFNRSEIKGERLPITNLYWWEILDYCNRLSEKYGFEPIYIFGEELFKEKFKENKIYMKLFEEDNENSKIGGLDFEDILELGNFNLENILDYRTYLAIIDEWLNRLDENDINSIIDKFECWDEIEELEETHYFIDLISKKINNKVLNKILKGILKKSIYGDYSSDIAEIVADYINKFDGEIILFLLIKILKGYGKINVGNIYNCYMREDFEHIESVGTIKNIHHTYYMKEIRIKQLDGEILPFEIADFGKTEGFRLPTQLEWEWFARGGEIAIQDGTFDTEYAGSNNIDEVAWYKENSEGTIHEVGNKKPNELGLYDCSGNVEEMCLDTYLDERREKEKCFIFKSGNYKSEKDEIKLEKGSEQTKNSYSFWHSSKVGFRIVRTVK